MDWIALPDAAVRQGIDSATVLTEFQRVQAEARGVAGGMYFKRQGDYEYLVRTSPDNRQQRVGARSPDRLSYRLSRDRPVSRASWVMPRARAMSPRAAASSAGSPSSRA